MFAGAGRKSATRPGRRGRHGFGGLAILLLWRPAHGGTRPPKKISEKALDAAWRYLTHKDLDLLGDWRFDKDFLRELNRKLVGESVGIIENFFTPALAEMVHNESLQTLAWNVAEGDPFEGTPLGKLGGLKEYGTQFNPNERCVFVDRGIRDPGFSPMEKGIFFRYNIQPELHRLPQQEQQKLPGRKAVEELFRQRKWIKGWTILLTGTDKGVDASYMTPAIFREYRPGDYINMHRDNGNDFVERRLCFNYWTPSPDWDPEWGGSFVWCGAGTQRPQETKSHFPAAFRAPTRYNQVGMFVPTEVSWHIVDRVSDAADPSRHRFSFTSWLEERHLPPGSVEL